MEDKRIKFMWLQTSGTGKSSGKLINPTDYFNSITRNNQVKTDKIIYLNQSVVSKYMYDIVEEEE